MAAAQILDESASEFAEQFAPTFAIVKLTERNCVHLSQNLRLQSASWTASIICREKFEGGKHDFFRCMKICIIKWSILITKHSREIKLENQS